MKGFNSRMEDMKNNNAKTRKKVSSLLDYYGFTKADERKYPVVSGILRELTPEKIESEVNRIKDIRLPPELQKWVDEYGKCGGKRNDFFWKWIYRAILETTFPMISNRYRNKKIMSEFLLVMFIILLDDLVDNHSNKIKLINNLLSIPQKSNKINFQANTKISKYSNFSLDVWSEILKNIEKLPRYNKFRHIFRYDVNQIMNALKYDYFVNENHFLINKEEFWLYSPHTMQIVAASMLDLMCIPRFNVEELGIVRKTAVKAQKMARIANWISTWRRELNSNDFTSGVFAYFLEKKPSYNKYLVKENKLNILKIIEKEEIEKDILEEWTNISNSLKKDCQNIKSIKLEKFRFGQERLLIMYLASEKII